MTTISGTAPVALLILRQPDPSAGSRPRDLPTDDLVGIATGLRTGATQEPQPANAKLSASLFSVNHQSVNELKLALIERTGKALGIDQADYESRDDFVKAMQEAFGKLKLEGGDMAVLGLEKKLGLDELGISLQDVIDGARQPGANDRVTKALEMQSGTSEDEDGGSSRFRVVLNDNGLYGLAA